MNPPVIVTAPAELPAFTVAECQARGMEAFAAGINRAPVLDAVLMARMERNQPMEPFLKAWLAGYDAAPF